MAQIKPNSGPFRSSFYKDNSQIKRQKNIKKNHYKKNYAKDKIYIDKELDKLNFYWARTPHNPYSIYACGD
tara:strand:- start:266 stop:478 length:213 start_codon:yes stop_codon:yes gene_type:complete